jgi:FKBP-type peptidyl-prolyl cis-trans isomerase
VPTNQQRRESSRRQLEKQLQERQLREAARKRFTLIASIISTVVVIVIVVVVIAVVAGSGGKKKQPAAAGTSRAAVGASVSFDGVTVAGAADLGGAPGVKSAGSTNPAKVEYKDLVLGTGAAATDSSAVTVQYVGALYKNGTVFDSSWTDGAAASFTLGPGNVIDGFTQGIGGTTGVPAMKVGGRRIVIMPSALAYGASPPSGSTIPANAPLVFVIDLKSISS